MSSPAQQGWFGFQYRHGIVAMGIGILVLLAALVGAFVQSRQLARQVASQARLIQSQERAHQASTADLRLDLERQIASLRAELAALERGAASDIEASVSQTDAAIEDLREAVRSDLQSLRLSLDGWIAEFGDHVVWSEQETARLRTELGERLTLAHEELIHGHSELIAQLQALDQGMRQEIEAVFARVAATESEFMRAAAHADELLGRVAANEVALANAAVRHTELESRVVASEIAIAETGDRILQAEQALATLELQFASLRDSVVEAMDLLASTQHALARADESLERIRRLEAQASAVEDALAALIGRIGDMERLALQTDERIGALEQAAEFTDARFAMAEGELLSASDRLAYIDAWIERAEEFALMEPQIIQVTAEPPPTREVVIIYRVQEGDVLWDIAASLTGSPLNYRRIMEMNGLEIPARLRAGQELRVPIQIVEAELEL